MILYRVMDDEVVAATSPRDLVEKLRRTSMSPVATRTAFRLRAAMWARELYGKQVRTANDDQFVADMLETGLWTLETVN